jgi:putative ABC transport system permease protein
MMNFPWLLKMAWRDSRKNLSRLVLFVSSIILGIAALVSIFALGDSLSAEIDNQAAALIGADLEISTNKPMPKNIQQLIDSIPGERAEQRSFASMVYFPRTNGTRLIQVRALEGNFPFYGAIETVPQIASRQFQQKRTALVDRSLMLQFNINAKINALHQLTDILRLCHLQMKIILVSQKINCGLMANKKHLDCPRC